MEGPRADKRGKEIVSTLQALPVLAQNFAVSCFFIQGVSTSQVPVMFALLFFIVCV